MVDGTIPEALFARIQEHPRINEMSRIFMSGSLDLAAKDKRIDGIFKDLGRYAAAIWSLYLHFTGALTLPRLKDVCRRSGMLSPGRARALLIYLQLLGYVKPLPKTAPGPRQYVPSPPLITAIKEQARFGLEALTIADPHMRTVLDHFDEPAFFRTFMMHFGEGALNASVVVDQGDPFWSIFLMRNAGAQVLQLILVSDIDLGGKPIPVSIAALARQLNVARSHIARVLRLAEEAKLIQRDGAGAIILSDTLREQAGRAFALRIVGYAICGALAYEAVIANPAA